MISVVQISDMRFRNVLNFSLEFSDLCCKTWWKLPEIREICISVLVLDSGGCGDGGDGGGGGGDEGEDDGGGVDATGGGGGREDEEGEGGGGLDSLVVDTMEVDMERRRI